jgi:hypothetical protein
MSLETWKAEFYAVNAGKVDAKDAVSHSLQKWTGLRPENLKKHDVLVDGGSVSDSDDVLLVDAATCALCYLYRSRVPAVPASLGTWRQGL